MGCKTTQNAMCMKKFLLTLLVSIVSLCAYAEFEPYCSGNDGVSYVQGHTETRNGTPTIYLDGYGKYANATVQVIVYSKGPDGVEREWYRDTVQIRDGEGKKILSTLNKATRVEIRVANYCN